MKQSNGRFMEYLTKNLAISAILSLLLVPTYTVALNSVKESEIRSVYSGFQSGFTKLDGTLTKLVDLSDLMTSDSCISRLIGIDGELQVSDFGLLSQAPSFLRNSIISDDLVINAYILPKKNRIFLSNSMVSEDRAKIYGTFYSINGYSMDDWVGAVLNGQRGFFFLPDAEANRNFDVADRQIRGETMHLVVPSPTTPDRSAQCAVVYMLDAGKVFSSFYSENLAGQSFAYLADKSGMIIADRGYEGCPLSLKDNISSGTIGGQDYTLLKAKGGKSGITAVIGINAQYFADRVKNVRNMILIYTAVILMTAVLLACLFAYRQYQPLKKLLSVAGKIYPGNTEKGYEYLSDTILSLDSERRQFRQEILSMDASIRGSLLERLLHGRLHTEKDAGRYLEYFHFSEECFCVFLMKIESCPDGREPMELSTRARAAVAERVVRETGCRVEFYNAEALRTDFVANFSAGAADPEAFRACLRGAAEEIAARLGVCAVFGVGSVVCGLKNVYTSAEEARNLLRMADSLDSVRIPSKEGPEPSRMIFDNNAGGKLYDLLFAGEMDCLEDFFRSTVRALEQNPPLATPEACQIFYGIRSVVDSAARSLYKGEKTAVLPVFSEDRNLKGQILSFLPVCGELCGFIATMKTGRSEKLQKEIVQYIRSAYRDGNLCALTVAEHFSVTEKAVYSAVKSLTGKSVGDFIEEIRFEGAEKLLRTTVNINKIPLMVGWNSTNTFYKAFKRVYGVSPGKWRECARQSGKSGRAL